MTLNTFVAGNPGEARAYAQELRTIGGGTETAATGAHQARTTAEGEWDGAASDAFQDWAKTQGTDGDELAAVYPSVARIHDTWADELDTVQARMEQAKQVARDGGLKLMGAHLILPPKAPTGSQPEPPKGRATAAQMEQYSADKAAYDAAMAEADRQQAVWEEAKATVTGAREKEKAAHETFTNALDKVKTQLQGIGQAGKWAQAGVRPASAAAGGLAQAATAMESSAAAATKSMFENSIGNPAAVNAAWSSMSTAQRADLVDRFPKMVGNADGLPTPVRHQANVSLLDQQRNNLIQRLKIVKANMRANPRMPLGDEKRQLEDALAGLDQVAETAKQPDKYLLSIDSTANDRGQVIIASGNPDTADNVSTVVPGTFSDLGDAMNYVEHGERIKGTAEQFALNESFANVTYVDYESPSQLYYAGADRYADDASGDIAKFQEGLRASHEGDAPSHNTIIGHSYGTTAIGYAAQDYGLPVDDMVLLGSPGTGAYHASQLGVPPERIWVGMNGFDEIKAVPNGWFGTDPHDPLFGASELPTETFSRHSDYFTDEKTVDRMGRVVAGQATGSPQPLHPEGR